jgi:hypothetical protein
MTALLAANLQNGFYWGSWTGGWDRVKPHVLDAFEISLNEFSTHVKIDGLEKELRKVLSQLCHPFPENRGHPKNINSQANSYNLERYVSIFDRLHKSVKYKLIK